MSLVKHFRYRQGYYDDWEPWEWAYWSRDLLPVLKRASNVRRMELSGRFEDLGWLRPLVEASQHCLGEVVVVNLAEHIGGSWDMKDLLPAIHLEKLHFYNRMRPELTPVGFSWVATQPETLVLYLKSLYKLKSLRLGGFHPEDGTVMRTSIDLTFYTWPDLEILELSQHAQSEESLGQCSTFFSRHPKLHTLSLVQSPNILSDDCIDLTGLSNTALTGLKNFVGQLSNASILLRSGRQGMESIGGVVLDEPSSNSDVPWHKTTAGTLLIAGLARQPLLIELDVTTATGIDQDAFDRVIRSTPKLKKLRWKGYAIGSWNQWTRSFDRLIHLEELSFPLHELALPPFVPPAGSLHLRAGGAVSYMVSLKWRVQDLAKRAPKLRYVEFAPDLPPGGEPPLPTAVIHRYPGTDEVSEVELTRTGPRWIRNADKEVHQWRSMLTASVPALDALRVRLHGMIKKGVTSRCNYDA